MTIYALAQTSPKAPLERVILDDAPPPKASEIDVEVEHCSVCHSDVHLLDGDWGAARPLIPGHEIVGKVVGTGRRVGIGWQAGACGTCASCKRQQEHLCTGGKVRTCVGRQGGFATRVRVDERFAFAIPEALDPSVAAPLLCAGLTVFSPLERLGVTKGTRVGIVGVGGLGHLAVRYAKALGADVLAFDPDLTKRELALSLGASDLVDAKGKLPRGVLDLILVTTHASLAWDDWMEVLDLEGTLCLVGVPGAPLTVGVDPLLDGQKKITGSVIGSPATMRRMLDFSATHGITPVIERLPMSRANEAVARVREGKARLRIILDADLG